MYPITEGQIKKIHVIKAELRLSEDEYRAILKGMFNVGSSKQLSFQQAKKLIEKLVQLYKKETTLTPAQLSRINYLASEVYKTNTYEKLKECIERNIGYSVPVASLSKKEATKIINTLEGIKKWLLKKRSTSKEIGS